MLAELAVRDLGVIAELSLVFGAGMTAVTGETGAGKTLLVEAIELLVGGRSDPVLVRPGAAEAWVEGRFVTDAQGLAGGGAGGWQTGAPQGGEVVLARVVPAAGRSRAYIDGRLAPLAALAQQGNRLVDLYGQHAHQSLLQAPAQRAALDRYGSLDSAPLAAARREVAEVVAELSELGGDARARAREIDLLRFQVGEVEGAKIVDPNEDELLEIEEERLADAAAHRDAAAAAHAALTGDGQAVDGIGTAIARVSGRRPFAEIEARLRAVAAEVADVAREVRELGEGIDDDPARLEEVRARRRLLRELERKYGESLDEVLSFALQARRRLQELESYEARAAELEARRREALERVAAAEKEVGEARRAAAPALAAAVEAHLRRLAMPRARFEVQVGDEDPGNDVKFLLGANPGEPALPLAKVASGGELARAMLAARLVLTDAPPTLIFDEVDAGIGGEAAVAVGQALAALARNAQVLVVTHLPQVAAFADHHLVVAKEEVGARTLAKAREVRGAERVVELSRMLSGRPGSATARRHAEELLAAATFAADAGQH